MPVVSSYDPIDGSDVGTGDDFLIVDVSDTSQAPTGTTKRITREHLTSAMGLGKYVAVGYGGLPTWTDPAATDWADVVANDYGWVQFAFGASGLTVTTGGGADATASLSADDNGGSPFGKFALAGDDGSGASYTLTAQAYGFDGQGAVIAASHIGDSGSAQIGVQAGVAAAILWAEGGQTDPLLDLEGGMFAVAPDGKVGGVTPNVGDQLTWDGSKIVWAAP